MMCSSCANVVVDYQLLEDLLADLSCGMYYFKMWYLQVETFYSCLFSSGRSTRYIICIFAGGHGRDVNVHSAAYRSSVNKLSDLDAQDKLLERADLRAVREGMFTFHFDFDIEQYMYPLLSPNAYTQKYS